jgi:hypothetical protein
LIFGILPLRFHPGMGFMRSFAGRKIHPDRFKRFSIAGFDYFCQKHKKNVRVVADIPHPRYKIQVFLYNGKYMVKIELGQFEQTFKIAESDVAGLEEVKRMVTEELLKNSLDRFLSMRTDWEQAFRENNSQT